MTLPFVGRSAELDRLRALLPGEAAGRVALVSGAAGSGKTRLVRELTAEAERDGVLVLSGVCDAVVRAPYGPFVEVLDQLNRTLPALRPEPDADPDTERLRLHTAVAELLASVDRPALLVLEDVHWADASTLLLLRHLARAPRGRLVVLATYRDTDADVPNELAEALAELRRHDVVHLRLPELSREEVAELVRLASGTRADDSLRALAASIHDLTEGNAFLVGELWRALLEAGAVEVTDDRLLVRRAPEELETPQGVRDVVGLRLARLAAGTRDVLDLAATAGATFEPDVIRTAAELDDAELVAAFDEAVGIGMVEPPPSQRGAWRFSHELVRRAAYDRLSVPRRAALHLRVGRALEAAEPPTGRRLADLAHHFTMAAPFGPADRAADYQVLAARADAAALAFGQAAERLRTALALDAGAPAARAALQLELGGACHRAGQALEAVAAFSAAADLARELGDPALMARAAIGYEEACWRPGLDHEGAVELLEEAAAVSGDGDSQLRVGLLSGLARALDKQGRQDRGALVRAEAIAMARRLGDRTGLATVLMRAAWSRGRTPVGEVLAMLREAEQLAADLGDTDILAEAMAWQVPTLLAACDLEGARRVSAAVREIAERTAQPFMVHVAEHHSAAVALCDGRLEEAEALARRSYEWGRLLTGRDASAIFGLKMFSIRRERGGLQDLAGVVRALAADRSRLATPWGPGLAALLAELGLREDAERELARLTADGLDPFRTSLWLASLVYLADAATLVRDQRVAALVYPELEPFAGENTVIGHVVCCYGAADRHLGMLAGVLGERDVAGEHFERAMALNRRMGAWTWVAHTAYEHGRLLQGTERGAALAAEAATLAERLGMPPLLSRARALSAPEAASPLPDGLSAREVQVLGLVAGGLTNRRVASTLSISEHTVANHVRSILHKTGCANRTEAASYAHRHGLAAR
jgi:DNA-binding CsgD family transcriptional regulator